MAALGSQSIASSYEQLLHVDRDGGGNSTTLVDVKDGDNGTTFALKLATDKIQVNGSIDLTGGQIAFPSTQSASANANTLDDYEVGTFTPTIAEYATPSNAMSTSSALGSYVKIGDMVSVSVFLNINGNGSATNVAMGVHGLPFTTENVATRPALAIGEQYNLNLNSGGSLAGWVLENQSSPKIYLLEATNTNYSSVTRDELSTNAFFSFSVTYKV